MDDLLERLQTYNQRLESEVKQKTESLKREKENADHLLQQMLPKSIAERLKKRTVGNGVFCSYFEYFRLLVFFLLFIEIK